MENRVRTITMSRQRPSDSPICSVIIPTYNRRALLARTLTQLSLQTTPKDQFEVIVVDDGSSDGTEDEVLLFKDRLDIRYFWQPDEGFRAAAARNVGLNHARGSIAIFIDSGVLPHSNCVMAHLQAHQADEVRKAVIGYVFCFDDENHDSGEIIEELNTSEIDVYIKNVRGLRTREDAREPIYRRCRDDIASVASPWGLFWTCNISVQIDDAQGVGLFDEHFRTWGAEDLEFGYRLHQAGVRIELCRQAEAVHFPHPFQAAPKRAGALANYRYFAKKHNLTIAKALMRDTPATYGHDESLSEQS
jgi:glycosyltransferase involved in cell wall biosynthesis